MGYRLPTLAELQSILEPSGNPRENTCVFDWPFSGSGSVDFWTSSTYLYLNMYLYYYTVRFTDGTVNGRAAGDNGIGATVRCVR